MRHTRDISAISSSRARRSSRPPRSPPRHAGVDPLHRAHLLELIQRRPQLLEARPHHRLDGRRLVSHPPAAPARPVQVRPPGRGGDERSAGLHPAPAPHQGTRTATSTRPASSPSPPRHPEARATKPSPGPRFRTGRPRTRSRSPPSPWRPPSDCTAPKCNPNVGQPATMGTMSQHLHNSRYTKSFDATVRIDLDGIARGIGEPGWRYGAEIIVCDECVTIGAESCVMYISI